MSALLLAAGLLPVALVVVFVSRLLGAVGGLS